MHNLEDLGKLIDDYGGTILLYPEPKTLPWQEHRVYLTSEGIAWFLAQLGAPMERSDALGSALAEKTAEGEPLPWALVGRVATYRGPLRIYRVSSPAAILGGALLRANLPPAPKRAPHG